MLTATLFGQVIGPTKGTHMFTGLSAFPLTPLHDDQVDEQAFIGLVQRLAAAGVDSITALGSTGSLCVSEPRRAAAGRPASS